MLSWGWVCKGECTLVHVERCIFKCICLKCVCVCSFLSFFSHWKLIRMTIGGMCSRERWSPEAAQQRRGREPTCEWMGTRRTIHPDVTCPPLGPPQRLSRLGHRVLTGTLFRCLVLPCCLYWAPSKSRTDLHRLGSCFWGWRVNANWLLNLTVSQKVGGALRGACFWLSWDQSKHF